MSSPTGPCSPSHARTTGSSASSGIAANRLGSCAAWDLETGSPDIVVAICDTGILATHEDLLLHKREGFHVPSQTWESQGGPINDINGYGTNCSGSPAANGNNSVGVAGMGWNLGHRTICVTDSGDGSASLSNLTLAARTAADAGDKVASVSYSGVNSSTVFTTGRDSTTPRVLRVALTCQ
jgi:thermitase